MKIDVDQKTKLGSLALAVLSERGFCGPPYDLSDLKVKIDRISKECISIDFYDMNTTINNQNKHYPALSNLFEDYLAKAG